MRVTDSWLKANYRRHRPDRLERADRDGLTIRVSPTGKVSYLVRYRYNGSPHTKRLLIGSYPRMTLAAARAETERLRGHLEQGHDPRVVRRLEKQAIVKAPTVEQLFRFWYEKYCVPQKVGHKEILRSFELYVFPKIGSLPADKVTLHQWLDVLESQAEERPSICERILTNSKQMMKWSVKRKLLPTNVLVDIYPKEDFRVDEDEEEVRALSDVEIRYVWQAIEYSRMALKNKLFLKLCLIFGCRNGELRRAKKLDFNFETTVWTVPRKHNKIRKSGGRPIRRPIIPEFVPIIKQAFALSPGSEYVFTNAGSDKPMGKGAPLQLPYNLMQWLRRHEKYEMEHWSVHALRKTARTNFSSLTPQPHIAEIMLGHKLPKSWRAYDKHDYLEEQAAVYADWWKRLAKITDGLAAPASAKRHRLRDGRSQSQGYADLISGQAWVETGLQREYGDIAA